MADPLSIAASVGGLITLAQVIIGKGYSYCNTVKDCPKEINDLLNEVTPLSGVLLALKPVVHRLASTEDANRSTNPIPFLVCAQLTPCVEDVTQLQQITSCTNTLEEIKKILDTFSGGKNGSGPSILTRMKWPLKKAGTQDLMDRLASYKRTFQLALSADTMQVA